MNHRTCLPRTRSTHYQLNVPDARSPVSNARAGRCRVVDGHYPLTCDQYEAQRGYEGVARCPGCGVYVVKGDGEKQKTSLDIPCPTGGKKPTRQIAFQP